MRGSAISIRPGIILFLFACSLLSLTIRGSDGIAAEVASPPSPSKESFNLILPFKDLTVGQGQEATMDAEVVNRTKGSAGTPSIVRLISTGSLVRFTTSASIVASCP